MASQWYPKGIDKLIGAATLTGGMESANVKVMILDSVHAYDEADEFVSDIVANEETYSAYVRKVLSGAVAVDLTANTVKFTFNDVVWTALGAGTAPAFFVIFYDGGTDATATLLLQDDPASADAPNGNDYTYAHAAGGHVIAY